MDLLDDHKILNSQSTRTYKTFVIMACRLVVGISTLFFVVHVYFLVLLLCWTHGVHGDTNVFKFISKFVESLTLVFPKSVAVLILEFSLKKINNPKNICISDSLNLEKSCFNLITEKLLQSNNELVFIIFKCLINTTELWFII